MRSVALPFVRRPESIAYRSPPAFSTRSVIVRLHLDRAHHAVEAGHDDDVGAAGLDRLRRPAAARCGGRAPSGRRRRSPRARRAAPSPRVAEVADGLLPGLRGCACRRSSRRASSGRCRSRAGWCCGSHGLRIGSHSLKLYHGNALDSFRRRRQRPLPSAGACLLPAAASTLTPCPQNAPRDAGQRPRGTTHEETLVSTTTLTPHQAGHAAWALRQAIEDDLQDVLDRLIPRALPGPRLGRAVGRRRGAPPRAAQPRRARGARHPRTGARTTRRRGQAGGSAQPNPGPLDADTLRPAGRKRRIRAYPRPLVRFLA